MLVADRATQLEQTAADALARLAGVAWTATANAVDASSGRPSDIAVPPLPEPLRMNFFVDPNDAGNWANVQPGATIRFTPQFSLAEPGDYPAITVHMTLIEAMQR
jgi:hypothetical protein